jgi:hypothetical protein
LGETAEFVGVGDQVDCHDSAMSNREPDNGAVDEGRSCLWCEPGAAREKLRRNVGGARDWWSGESAGLAGVGSEDDVGVENRQQRVELSGAGGSDDLALMG